MNLRLLLFVSIHMFRAQASNLFNRENNASNNATCTPNCGAVAWDTIYGWLQYDVTTSITAATIIYIRNNRTGTTRTVTKYNDLPSGYTMPPINDAGTHITRIPITDSAGVSSELELAYPTGFVEHPMEYDWSGVLPTTDSMGKSVCSTVPQSSPVTVSYSPHKTAPQVSPTSTNAQDPAGLLYFLESHGCAYPPNPSYNSNDGAVKYCSKVAYCGVHAEMTARLLTETSISDEDTGPTDTNTSPEVTSTQAVTAESQIAETTNSGAAPATSQNAEAPVPITVGKTTYTANSDSMYIISSQTLSAGGQITVQGTTVSLAPSASVAVVNGASQALKPSPTVIVATYMTLNSQTISVHSKSEYVVAGQTLAPGVAATVISGTSKDVFSIATDTAGHSVIVVNGETASMPNPTVTTITPVATGPVLTLNGQTLSMDSKTEYILDGVTLEPGSTATVGAGSSEAVVLITTDSAGQSIAIVNGMTSNLPTPGTTATSTGTGDYIASGLGGSTTNGVSASSTSSISSEGNSIVYETLTTSLSLAMLILSLLVA